MNEYDKLAKDKMYELAEKRGLIPQLIILCVDARKEAGKIGGRELSWSIHGLLNSLGEKIEEEMKIKYPVLCEDKKNELKIID